MQSHDDHLRTPPRCPRCTKGRVYRDGFTGVGIQRWQCQSCRLTFRPGYAPRARYDEATRVRALEVIASGGSLARAAVMADTDGEFVPARTTVLRWVRKRGGDDRTTGSSFRES